MVLLGQVAFAMWSLAFLAILRKLYICLKKNQSLRLLGPSTANKNSISELPDDILTSIIARVPIKSAIRTSILSQRWRNLHRFVTSIDLDCGLLVDDYYLDNENDHESHNCKQIIDSVHRFLRLWAGSKIRTFRLYCCLNKSATRRLEQCINSLGRLGIEKLVLSSSWAFDDLSFSCHLLSEMPSLRYFHLSFCVLQPSLKSQCNSLKILYLSCVTLLPGAIECVLSSCLRLETLDINACESPSKLSFRASHLKTLDIRGCTCVKDIELYANNLVLFGYSISQDANSDINFIFGHVPQLESVSLDIWEKYTVPYVCRKLPNDLPNLKSLRLTTGGDIYQGSNRLLGINMFSKLRQLDLEVYSMERVDLLLLTQLLRSCPLLQNFGLHTDISEYDLPQREKPAVLFHSELRKMELSGFIGTENHIEFALYILKCATGLEKMLISSGIKIYYGYGRWFSRNDDPWSEETHSMILRQLQGQAVCSSAQLIIQQEPHIEDYNWIDAEDDYD